MMLNKNEIKTKNFVGIEKKEIFQKIQPMFSI